VSLYRRITLLLLLAAFTTGTFADSIVMQSKSIGTISSAMESGDVERTDMDMDECFDCLPGSDYDEGCEADCVTPMGIALNTNALACPMATESFPIAFVNTHIGTNNPPEPIPPRSFRLI